MSRAELLQGPRAGAAEFISRVRNAHGDPFLLAVGLAVFTVGFIHFWRLGGVPPGFFVDESGIAYAAWGIASDGHDEHGVAWPLYFESFGDYKNPPMIYLVAAVVRVFGLSNYAVRSVPAALSVGTAALLAGLAWELFRRRWLALATFAVAGVLPWLLVLGRTGFEASAQPLLLSLFLLLWLRCDRRGGWWLAALAGVALGLSGYAYSTGRLFLPLLVLALVAAYFPWRRGSQVAICGLTSMLVWLPAVAWNTAHPGLLTARFQLISVFNIAHTLPEILAASWRVYTSAFSFTFLFENTYFIQGGELFVTLAPFLAVGVAALWTARHDPFWRLVALGLLLAPVPGALTTDFAHQIRNLEAAPFWLLLAGLGAARLDEALGSGRRWIVAALGVALAIEAAVFLSDYFTSYPDRIAGWNQAGLDRAVAAAAVHRTDSASNGSVVISDRVFAANIQYAYFSREDIRAYRSRGLAAVGARVEPVNRLLPRGTVLLTGPDEHPPNTVVVTRITIPTTDSWGHSKPMPAWIIWRALGP